MAGTCLVRMSWNSLGSVLGSTKRISATDGTGYRLADETNAIPGQNRALGAPLGFLPGGG